MEVIGLLVSKKFEFFYGVESKLYALILSF